MAIVDKPPRATRRFPEDSRGGAQDGQPRRRAGRRPPVAGALAFAAAFVLVLACALRGGSYDVVARHELALVAWWALGLGFACGLLPRARPARPALVLLGVIAAFGAWTTASLAWTSSAERTSEEIARVLGYAGLVALVLATLDRATWRAAALGLGTGAMAVCGLALASRLAPGLVAPGPLARTTDRLSYPFGYWNAVGTWGTMCAVAALAFSGEVRNLAARAVACALVPVALLVTYLTYSRASAVATALGAVVVLVATRRRVPLVLNLLAGAVGTTLEVLAVRSSPQVASATGTRGVGLVLAATTAAVALSAAAAIVSGRSVIRRARVPASVGRPLAGLLIVAALVAAGAVAPSAWRNFKRPAVAVGADPAARLTQLSGNRYQLWRVALRSLAEHPLTGTGAGTFEFTWDRRRTDAEFVRNAHSLELENGAELGLPGIALILGVVAAAATVLVALRRRVRRGASVGAAVGGMAAFSVWVFEASVDWMWQSTAVTALALGIVAVAAARLSGPRPRARWWARAGLAAVAMCAALVQLPGLLSTIELRRSQAAERAGHAGAALAWASAAHVAEPWAASPYDQRGLVLEAAGRYAAAASDLRRAAALEPDNFRHWLLLTRIDFERGRKADAARAYARYQALLPLH